MPKIMDPTPVVHEVRVETSLATIYFRKLESMFGDDLDVKDWLYDSGRIRRIRLTEPEFGRGLTFWVTGRMAEATRPVARLIAKAEAMFDERERGLLAREEEIAREQAIEDAQAGI